MNDFKVGDRVCVGVSAGEVSELLPAKGMVKVDWDNGTTSCKFRHLLSKGK